MLYQGHVQVWLYLIVIYNASFKKSYIQACLLYDTAISGTVVGTTPNTDLNSCSYECKDDPNCDVWTFNFITRECHKKADDGGGITEFAHNHISGDKACNANRTSHCVKPDTEFVGNVLARQDTGDIIACQRACNDHPQCSHWEWDITEDPFQKCLMKFISSTDPDQVAKIGSLAAPKNCVPAHSHISN